MKKTITRSLIFALIYTSIFACTLGWYLVSRSQTYQNTVYPNVLVNNQSFEGKTQESIKDTFEPINDTFAGMMFQVNYGDTIATFSGSTLRLRYDTDAIAQQALSIGRSPKIATQLMQRIATIGNFTTYSFTHVPVFNLQPLEEYVHELEQIYNIPPQNALFEFDPVNKRVSQFKVEKDGFVIQSDKFLQEVQHYLQNDLIAKNSHKMLHSFVISHDVKKPEITLENANDLGIKGKIGEGKSDYTGSSAERAHNVILAASKFHGVLIPPGEVFSYNRTVGDISVSTGYKTAYVIKNGRTVLGDGGGVCQDSTTLFRAALNTGLPIVERHAHAYRVKYYENDSKPGFDATVYNPSADLRFKNDTLGYILIQTHVNQNTNQLQFDFYGTPDGRKVDLSDPIVYDIRPAPAPLYQDDPTLPKGTVKQVDWAAGGARSYFTYKVTHADGTVTEDRTFYSNYRPWQAVFLVGTQ